MDIDEKVLAHLCKLANLTVEQATKQVYEVPARLDRLHTEPFYIKTDEGYTGLLLIDVHNRITGELTVIPTDCAYGWDTYKVNVLDVLFKDELPKEEI